MNTASCAICKDVYTQSSTLIATPCGHIFHQDCITRCMASTSRVCPMCRMTLRQDKLLRLYFDFDRNRSIVEDSVDVNELQHTLCDLRSQLMLSEARCVEADRQVVERTNSLEKECAIAASLRDQLDDLRKSERLLRAELKRSQENLRCALAATNDSDALRRELEQLTDLRRVVRGKEDDVRAMIEERGRSSDAIRDLCVWTCILKEEREALKKDRKLKLEDLSRLSKKLKTTETDLATALNQVQKSELTLKEILQENLSLKRRLNKFVLAHESAKKKKAQSNLQMTPDVTNGFLRRMINESPFPVDLLRDKVNVSAESLINHKENQNVSCVDLFETCCETPPSSTKPENRQNVGTSVQSLSMDQALSKPQNRQHVGTSVQSLSMDQALSKPKNRQHVGTSLQSLSMDQALSKPQNQQHVGTSVQSLSMDQALSKPENRQHVGKPVSLSVDLNSPERECQRHVGKSMVSLVVDLTSPDCESHPQTSLLKPLSLQTLSILQPRVPGFSSFMRTGYERFRWSY